MDKKQIDKSIGLIQGYYKFLYLGLFLENIIKENDISQFAKDINIKTGTKTSFKLNEKTIQKLLKEIYNNPDKQNIFGYFTELTMFRGISSTMKELLDNNNEFKYFIKERLGNNYFHFDQIIRFIRNVLSHNIDTNILIKTEDYESQKIYLLYNQGPLINFDFKYKKSFDKYRKGNKDYGLKIKINFKKLSHNDKFFNIISIHDLFMISELCYNMIEIYKYEYK
ncbi:hypothetical protein [Candidatus Vampirococcus lugosii]|uniref:pEK499-p136 HEPN domain-containing protein n=1 Tax=Candidatus Vampirococcus lugosii TaxID=2789015 RepID=A0ABS5QJW0_9BACT|nr:hypothetical protein [Candidatus Vampirococcus lugosii]MBS8121556.1 hypothetical protein [Candidatus Vampirococcus lugosii]